MSRELILPIVLFALVIFVVAIIVAAIVIKIAIFKYKRKRKKNPAQIKDFRLNGEWIEICQEKPATLVFDNSGLYYESPYFKEKFVGYKVNSETMLFKNTIRISIEGCDIPFEHFEFHREKINDKIIPVISGVIFEFDGRGEIVVGEFVKVSDKKYVPDDYISPFAESCNNKEPIKTYIEVNE